MIAMKILLATMVLGATLSFAGCGSSSGSGSISESNALLSTPASGVSPAPGRRGFPGGFVHPGRCKRGIADINITSLDDTAALAGGVHWWYNWNPQPTAYGGPAVLGDTASTGMEYVPMVWGTQYIGQALAPSSTVLGYNEPQAPDQSDMAPQLGVSLWPQVESAAKAAEIGKIASPAADIIWANEFVTLCSGCQVDYIAVHSYPTSLSGLQSFVQAFEIFNKPIWVTEFACQGCSLAQQEAFMKAAVPWLESDSHIMRYAWYSEPDAANSSNQSLLIGSELTPLGQIYVNLPSSCGSP